MNLRRLWPRKQTARCARCSLLITERKRKPCPVCGSLGRIVNLSVSDAVSADVTF